MPDSDDFTVYAMYKFLNDQVQMAHNDTMQREMANYSKRDSFGNPIGKSHSNHSMDTRRYKFEFLDGIVK